MKAAKPKSLANVMVRAAKERDYDLMMQGVFMMISMIAENPSLVDDPFFSPIIKAFHASAGDNVSPGDSASLGGNVSLLQQKYAAHLVADILKDVQIPFEAPVASKSTKPTDRQHLAKIFVQAAEKYANERVYHDPGTHLLLLTKELAGMMAKDPSVRQDADLGPIIRVLGQVQNIGSAAEISAAIVANRKGLTL